MKILYFFVAFLSFNAFSQISVEGVVKDEKTLTPLEEVRIQLRPISKKGAGYWTGTMTKKNGLYKVSTSMKLPATISYQKEGCGKKSIKIKEGDKVPSEVFLDCTDDAIKAIIIEQTLDTDGDGLVDKDDKCPKEAGSIENEGCPVEGDSVSDKAAAIAKAEAIAKAAVEKKNSAIPPPPTSIYFKANDFNVSLSYKNNSRLNVIGDFLLNNLSAKINIEGHASSDGSSEYNMALSEKRVLMVKQALVDLGINPSRLTVKSFGEDKPAQSNSTSQGRSDNRRVVISMQ